MPRQEGARRPPGLPFARGMSLRAFPLSEGKERYADSQNSQRAFRAVPLLAQGRPDRGPGADHGLLPRRPRGPHGQGARPWRQGCRQPLRQSHAVRPQRGLRLLSARLRARPRRGRSAWRRRALCARTCRTLRTRCSHVGRSARDERRALRRLPPHPLPGRVHRLHQALHAHPGRLRRLRRKGLAAAGHPAPHGPRPLLSCDHCLRACPAG